MQGKAKIAGKVSPVHVENSCCYAVYNESVVIQLDQVHKLASIKQQEVETTYNPTVNK